MMQRANLHPIGIAILLVVGASCGSDASTASDADATTSSLPEIAAAATTVPPTTVPATTTTLAAYYEVQPGDSLSAIAAKFDVRMEDLVSINEITDPNRIQVGQKLMIPPPTILLNDATTVAGAAVTAASSTSAP